MGAMLFRSAVMIDLRVPSQFSRHKEQGPMEGDTFTTSFTSPTHIPSTRFSNTSIRCKMSLVAPRKPLKSSLRHTSLEHEHECTDCISEYATSSMDLTSQCTDQCVVIACDDPAHSATTCNGVGDPNHCDLVCEDSVECQDCAGLDNFLQCCTDFHSYLSDPKNHDPSLWSPFTAGKPIPLSSERENDEFYQVSHLPQDSSYVLPQHFHSSVDITEPSIFTHHSPMSPVEASFDYSNQYQAIPPDVRSSMSLPNRQHSVPPSPNNAHNTHNTHNLSMHSEQSFGFSYQDLSSSIQSSIPSPTQHGNEHDSASYSPNQQVPFLACMWGQCRAQFSTPEELISHVNSQHLSQNSSNTAATHCEPHPHASKFSCLWRDCHEFFPELVDAPSHERPHAPYDTLTSHILSHHLGYPGPNLPPLPKYPQDYPKEYLDVLSTHFPDVQDIEAELSSSGGLSSRSVTPPQQQQSLLGHEENHQCGGEHVCHWHSCGKTFDSCDALTAHLNIAHVGSGKPHYDCYWGDCGRNEQNGFTSKQKICRHLQSHTGHRPFQCKLCNQNFSEAATLQQHMRRHTREKPYVCDYPGCGKSFAITGALTIHKRTHNGHKPFKCSHCDRAFAESSNLSKHLRTHTGARPYPCPEPGCNKAFARPDQLTRHASVHRKKQEKNVTDLKPVSTS